MNPIVAFAKLIRLPNLLIIALVQYAIRYGIIYPILSNSIADNVELQLQMSNIDFLLITLSTVMIAAAGYIINDYFDLKTDRVNRPDRIIVGKYIKRRVVMGAHIVINTIAIIIGAYVAYKVGNLKLVTIQLLSAGALWYYSVSFKKQVLIGNVVVALLAALVPLVAGLYEVILQHANATVIVNGLLPYVDAEMNDVMPLFQLILSNIMKWVLGFSLFAFLTTIVREVIKDIEDYDGDKKYFSNTLPVVYGKEKGKIVAQFFALIIVVLVGFLQYMQIQSEDVNSAMYFLITVQIPLLYIVYKLRQAKQKGDYSKLSTYTKLVMLFGIMYAGLFYYSITYF